MMLEQWYADALLAMPKVYSDDAVVDLSIGAQNDYAIEAVDESATFILDVRRPLRNRNKATYQLRYRRDIVLARLCTRVPHTSPDGTRLEFPHLHVYTEGDGDRWASELRSAALDELLFEFCDRISLPHPDVQGGVL